MTKTRRKEVGPPANAPRKTPAGVGRKNSEDDYDEFTLKLPTSFVVLMVCLFVAFCDGSDGKDLHDALIESISNGR